MGFYLEMQGVDSPHPHSQAREFAEKTVPIVFWGLYTFAGFALLCMGFSAHSLLGDLARLGSQWDQVIVWAILSAIPLFIVIGLKMLGLRKFIRFDETTLRRGFRFFGRTLWEKKIPRNKVLSVDLLNRRPSPNIAPRQHEDSQYFIRGHWVVRLNLRGGKSLILDKHTEKGTLVPLYTELLHWITS